MKHNKYIHHKYDTEAKAIYLDKYISRFNYSLYHWSPTHLTQKIIHSKHLRMTSAYEFEDKEEFKRGIKYIIESITSNRHSNAKFQLALGIKAHLEELIETKEWVPYVVCLTANKHNSYTKKHYGSQGKGGLFKISPTRKGSRKFLVVTTVIYDYALFQNRASQLLGEYIDLLSDYLLKGEASRNAFHNIVPLLMRDIMILAISYKHRSFSQEEEIRFVSFSNTDLDINIKKRFRIFPRKLYHLKKIN